MLHGLKKATGDPSGLLWTETYSYDRNGNRTTVTATGTADDGSPIPRDGFAALAYGATTNRITTAGWQYDAAGNQVRAQNSAGVWQRFQYDAANRLAKVKADNNITVIASYTYGDDNQRLIADEGGVRTYYATNGGSVLTEYTESGTSTTPIWSKSYVYLGNRLLSTLTPNGSGGESFEYHHPDRLGTRVVTNPTTGSSFEQVTLPFGTALNAESTGATNRRFTSYDRSSTTGLDYAVNRHYDSQQGRFTQVDPAGMGSVSPASPQTLNLYAYCANDPINHIDPSGLGFFSFIAKLYRAVKKVLKWVAIVVAVALAVVFTFVLLSLPGTQFLAGIVFKGLGLLLGFMAKAGIMAFAEGVGFSIGLTGQVFAGAMTVGAIANHLQQNRRQDQDKNKDKRPPKERPLIIERPKLPRGKTPTPEEAYNQCVATYEHIFNQDVETLTAEADKHYEERKGPWLLNKIYETYEILDSIKSLISGDEIDPGDGGSLRDLLNQQTRNTEIEKRTQDAAARRDDRIQKNCKKP